MYFGPKYHDYGGGCIAHEFASTLAGYLALRGEKPSVTCSNLLGDPLSSIV
jgi:hypothetical protein